MTSLSAFIVKHKTQTGFIFVLFTFYFKEIQNDDALKTYLLMFSSQ